MLKTVLVLERAFNLAARIKDNYQFAALMTEADALASSCRASADEIFAIHEELKELRQRPELPETKCFAKCKLKDCPDFNKCPDHWGDLNEVIT